MLILTLTVILFESLTDEVLVSNLVCNSWGKASVSRYLKVMKVMK